jgi:uncharacterized protein with PQ loop repeat
MLELLGFLGGICFAISSVPITIKTIQMGKSEGIPVSSMYAIWLGAVLMATYLIVKNGFDAAVFFDYGITISGWTVVLFYYYFPRKTK